MLVASAATLKNGSLISISISVPGKAGKTTAGAGNTAVGFGAVGISASAYCTKSRPFPDTSRQRSSLPPPVGSENASRNSAGRDPDASAGSTG